MVEEEAADIAAAAVAAVMVVGDVAVEEAGDKRVIDGRKTMKTKRNTMTSSKMIVLAAAILTTGFLASVSVAARGRNEAAAKQDAQGTPQPGQKEFDTPKQAADALIQVAANFDVAAAKEILGPDSDDIISSRRSGAWTKTARPAFANQGKRKDLSRIRQERSEPRHSPGW